ncbi:MAG: metalloregulator ArsR/SmtB family transcription factor [Chloroflexi bacterium]|nr:metalloregulator ArsR/SmtB family transcription factor [Chloroflexota bacterium]
MIRPVNVIPLEARLFRSMGDEGRLAVLEALVPAEQRVADLVHMTEQSQSTVSTHLAALHAAGLVARRQDGRQVWYGLARPSVTTLLDAAEEVVLAASGETYACTSPCCSPDTLPF